MSALWNFIDSFERSHTRGYDFSENIYIQSRFFLSILSVRGGMEIPTMMSSEQTLKLIGEKMF